MWKFLSSLWTENPQSRPEMAHVVQELTQMEDSIDDELDCSSVESDKVKSRSENSSSSEDEAFVVNPSLPDVNGQILKGRVTKDSHFPFARGGNSNIFRGRFTRSDGRKIRVAIKMILFDEGSDQADEALRRLKREAEIWAQLKHKHLVPFIGVCDDVAPWPVLVSPLYKRGHVVQFLRKNPGANRPDTVIGVASGLEYLHANGIVHGDLKGPNVLVDKRGVPYICDFGISKILNRSGFTTSSVGTCPYMAPELFIVVNGGSNPEIRPSTTTSSDVYSFALLAVEILTSEPLKARPTVPFMKTETFSKLRPKRTDYIKVTDEEWSVLDECWEFNPDSRPTISEVRRRLSSAFNASTVDALDAGQYTLLSTVTSTNIFRFQPQSNQMWFKEQILCIGH
ncbi:kinase-like domain-containing protein [Mycena albidolilacea]|uniref:Kinase-like domain-containing protein n=1 Tax=Mycena albidolilacea TaxID=1033008 RepID=A0AAD7ES38_9AGAR|nr:kinase-like domain-containing protein [Mycena albidolilacea]